MRKVTLLLLLIQSFTFIDVKSQNIDFAPIGAKWWFSTFCFSEPDCGYFTIESKRDTLINGVTAKIIESELFGGDSWSDNYFTSSPLIMRSENNKVYRYDTLNGDFYVLYDFDLQAGDTLTIQDSSIYRGYINYSGENDNAIFQVIVDSNVVKLYNGYLLRHLYTSPTTGSDYFFNGPIIERIGNLHNLIGQATVMITAGFPEYLRCYKDNLIDLTSNNCDYITSVRFKEDDNLKFYPNPVSSGVLNITTKNEGNLNEIYLRILDFTGKEILDHEFYGQAESIQLNVSNIPNGVYFLEIQYDNHRKSIEKIVISKQ